MRYYDAKSMALIYALTYRYGWDSRLQELAKASRLVKGYPTVPDQVRGWLAGIAAAEGFRNGK